MLSMADRTPLRAEFLLQVQNNTAGLRELVAEDKELLPVISYCQVKM